MRFFYYLLIASFLISCNARKPSALVFKTPDFILIDTATIAVNKKGIGDSPEYPIYYLGPVADTIKIGKRYKLGITPWTGGGRRYPSYRYSYTGDKLKIIVDTSVETNAPSEYYSGDPKVVSDSTINFSSFLLTIRNISDSSIYITRTLSILLLHLEVKNKLGQWLKLEKSAGEYDVCSTGQPYVSLSPNEIIISKLRRYKGDVLTDFRLVFGYDNNVCYSNTFKDLIDKKIFEFTLNVKVL